MIFGTPCGHSSENLRDFLVQIMILFLDQKISGIFRTMTRGGTETLQAQKETPEMNVSERDLIPVKISASNSKNSRSYSIFGKVEKKFASQAEILIYVSRGR